ncbi:hypothetical protein LZD49_33635 [Dyadobacter sp. CY261]|uniref:hypothetical protein n=1 Tax=Dyadobacter sp. CY261 TaxID=2907203 RepID=UPI001F15B2AD|nr:hypothetical protein [Dyadobacter sp. CY261]MCF0075470.1 hypothetical protein [Dyadobacter sp. CY261]
MTDAETLLPCPFCPDSELNEFVHYFMFGSKAVDMVQCENCDCTAPKNRWQTRAQVTAPVVSRMEVLRARAEWENSDHLIGPDLHWKTKQVISTLLEAAAKETNNG